MSVQTYEGLFLLDANRASSDWDGCAAQVNAIITKHGGEILHSQPWEVQKLAYPINRSRKGTFLLTYFRVDSLQMGPIEADFRISEFIVRKMIIKLHPKVAPGVLAHYTNEQTHVPEREAVEA